MELIKHGKQDWMVPRDDTVEAKGKGKLVTYWLRLHSDHINAESTAASSEWNEDEALQTPSIAKIWKTAGVAAVSAGRTKQSLEEKTNRRNQRLVDWNSELLLQLLKHVVARRETRQLSTGPTPAELTATARKIGAGSMVVEEVAEIIELPEFIITNRIAQLQQQLSAEVVKQLYDYVAKIASMYNDNPCKLRESGRQTRRFHGIDTLTRMVLFFLSTVHNFEHVRYINKQSASSSRWMAKLRRMQNP
jgi:DNA primase